MLGKAADLANRLLVQAVPQVDEGVVFSTINPDPIDPRLRHCSSPSGVGAAFLRARHSSHTSKTSATKRARFRA